MKCEMSDRSFVQSVVRLCVVSYIFDDVDVEEEEESQTTTLHNIYESKKRRSDQQGNSEGIQVPNCQGDFSHMFRTA